MQGRGPTGRSSRFTSERSPSQRGLSRQPRSWLGGSPGHGRRGKEHRRHVDSPPSFTSSPLDSPLRCRELPTSRSHPLDLSAGNSPHGSAGTRRESPAPLLASRLGSDISPTFTFRGVLFVSVLLKGSSRLKRECLVFLELKSEACDFKYLC